VTFDNCAESACSVCVGKKQSMDTFYAIFYWKMPLATHDLETFFIQFSYFAQNFGYSSIEKHHPLIFM